MEPTTKLFNFRLSIDLMDAVKAKAGKTSMTDVVTVALSDYVAGSPASQPPDQRVAELEAENARLLTERNQWRDRAQAIVSAGAAKQPARRGADPMGRSAHPAGPVLATTAPEVAGQTGWCGLKGLDKAKR